MEPTSDLRKALQNLDSVFSKTAIECANVFFSRICTLQKPFVVTESLEAGFDFLLSLNANSSTHNALACIGINQDTLDGLLKKQAVAVEDASDILGEFANTYLGMLQDDPLFVTTFGRLLQGVPFLYMKGSLYLPFIWGIEGAIDVFEGKSLYIGFSIREIVPAQKWNGFSPVKIESRMGYAWCTLPGTLNLKHYTDLQDERLTDLLESPIGIVLDLQQVANIFSIYIRFIVRLKLYADKLGIPMYIVNVSEHCRHVLEVSKMTKVLRIFATEKEFLDSIQARE